MKTSLGNEPIAMNLFHSWNILAWFVNVIWHFIPAIHGGNKSAFMFKPFSSMMIRDSLLVKVLYFLIRNRALH